MGTRHIFGKDTKRQERGSILPSIGVIIGFISCWIGWEMSEFIRSDVILEVIPFFVLAVILDVVYMPGVIKDGLIIGCNSQEEFMGCVKRFCEL
jgi:hypothetical protein